MMTGVVMTTGVPSEVNVLLGRRADIAAVTHALEDARLVTLVGPGGVGKTRLAEAVARHVEAGFPGGVCWVELGGLADPAAIVPAVASAMHVAFVGPGADAATVLAEWIGPQVLLLVLDNCEHLAAGCAEMVDVLLRRCPAVRVLATSRETLGVPGEARFPVEPLALPPADTPADPQTLVGYAAVQLLIARIRAVAASFALDSSTADAVLRTCRLVDGLPLALELAAARVRVLPIQDVADGLHDLFHVLGTGPRTAPHRQQTLRATLDWSHRLLSTPEQELFRRMAIFAGDPTLRSIEDVAAALGADRAAVLDLLTTLTDKSLVSARPGRPTRYRMLRTVRGYALRRLADSGEELAARRAHLASIAAIAQADEAALVGAAEADVLARFDASIDDITAALSFAEADGTPAGRIAALQIAAAVGRYCYLRGRYRDGRDWLDRALAGAPEAPAPLRAKGLFGAGRLAFLLCDYAAAVERLDRALELQRELGDAAGAAATLQALGGVAREQGRYADAAARYAESGELAERCADDCARARADSYLGFLAWLQADFGTARRHCEHALQRFRSLADTEGIAWSLLSLGVIASYAGVHEQAEALLTESRALSEQAGYREGIAWTRHELGVLAGRTGDLSAAADLLLSALSLHGELGDRWRTVSVLADLAGTAAALDRPDAAARLLGAAQQLRDDLGCPVPLVEAPDLDRIVARVRAALGPAGFDSAVSAGRTAPLDDLVHPDVFRPAPQPRRQSAEPAPAPAAPPVPALRIRLFGTPSVESSGRTLGPADFGYAKPRELLFLLASGPDLTKSEIAAALWPEQSAVEVRNSLHTALKHLRGALGDPGLVTHRAGRYVLERGGRVWVDVDAFSAALTAAAAAGPDGLADYRRAVGLYTGDLLAGVPTGDWVNPRREVLRRAYHRGLARAGRMLTRANRHHDAADMFARVVASDPLLEAAHRDLMRSWARAGERARAIRHYQELARQLADDLGVSPAPETTALYRHLLDGRDG